MKLRLIARRKIDIDIKQQGNPARQQEVIFTAYLNGQEVGEINLTVPMVEDPEAHDYIPGEEDNNYYGVTYIYVEEGLRGRGIAQQLIEHAEAIISQYQSESLQPNTLITELGEKFFR